MTASDRPAIAPIEPGSVSDVEVVTDMPGDMVVVLERIEPGVDPQYCTHGRATCIGCQDWVWLGHATHDVVKSRQAAPLCQDCGTKYLSPDQLAGQVHDDTPHP